MKSFILTVFTMSILSCSAHSRVDESPIASFDLERYMGLWYEIARYDNRFECGMTDVTAMYTLLDDGKVRVENSGTRDGVRHTAIGKAKVGEPAANGFLKVSFFLNFYAPYRVIMLADDYSYALVTSGEKYLWILSRTPQLDESVKQKILDEATRRGFDVDKLIY